MSEERRKAHESISFTASESDGTPVKEIPKAVDAVPVLQLYAIGKLGAETVIHTRSP